MKHFKGFLVSSVLAVALLGGVSGFSAEPAAKKEDLFSMKGTVTQIDTAEKILRAKNPAGLELTFRVEKGESLAGLAANDPVEISYVYNENFEKVARTLTKPASSEKTQAPSP